MSSFDFDSVQALYVEHVQSNYSSFPQMLLLDQAKAIHGTLNGSDVLLILPTGYGKTLTFIVPTIISSKLAGEVKVCIIVSPLNAVMTTMEEKMTSLGLDFLQCTPSSLSSGQLQDYTDTRALGSPLFLTIPPELHSSKKMKAFLYAQKVYHLVVDEGEQPLQIGHLVQKWGKSFRKDYSTIHELHAFCSFSSTVATATMPSNMVENVIRKVGLNKNQMVTVTQLPYRHEIFLQRFESSSGLNSIDFIVSDLNSNACNSTKTIIFVRSIPTSTKVFLWLRQHCKDSSAYIVNGKKKGYMVDLFSASTHDPTKKRILRVFSITGGYLRVVVATVAFGLGVDDFADVRRVNIWDLPDSVSTLWQERRAGRDKKQCHAMIFQPKTSKKGFFFTMNQCMVKEVMQMFIQPGDEFVQPAYDQTHENCESDFCRCRLCMCCSVCYNSCSCILKRVPEFLPL